MTINWPLIIVLFALSTPGVIIAVPRLIRFLLPDSSKSLIQRVSRLAVMQTLFMVFILSLGGAVLSRSTGLQAEILEAFLQGKVSWISLQNLLTPVLLYAFIITLVFCVFFYGVLASILDEHSFQIMRKLHRTLGLDGCVLYGGVAEEILARWGLVNVTAFFAILLTHSRSDSIMWFSVIISALLFSFSQLPAYIAAGCKKNRRFIFSFLFLHLWLGIMFGFLFWQYGLLAAILSHMLFHAFWSLYDKK
ncbi:CPBP family intramembrane metalloprotease [Legionella israelensis]|uniref:CPBP family intramembrane metalloprotease n=1 Tax=Legionella israelensis TaxID=454 RepID=UPI00117F638B|nr:CPBP family intramembrane metalloprotease [Legionella israelensis]QDP73376.1 CPBP family intramembrane metalloprotease [Legionella israelensis]